MSDPSLLSRAALPALDDARQPSMTDQVFQALYDRVIDLTLPPGTKLSEAEVAAQMGVSRQPVRDAFYRLSQLGLILIRPQRATTVTHISEPAVRQASFIRSALEVSVVSAASGRLTPAHHDALDELIAQQSQAIDTGQRDVFHALDDLFHRRICELADLGFAWTLIRDNKAHMDRARYLSLSSGGPSALQDHRRIAAALRAGNAPEAAEAMRIHLGRIHAILDRLRHENPTVFGGAS